MGQLPALHEHEALADLAQDLEVEVLVRVQAQEHHAALGAQAAEEVEHEADIAVLGVELWFVEQVDQRVVAAGPVHQEGRPDAPEMPDLIGLVIRSEERRGGKECVSTCRYRWSSYN